MAKFSGKVGFAEEVKIRPGVTDERIVERKLYGDVLTNGRRLEGTDKVVPDISTNNRISVFADSYANEHAFAMRYVEWAGVCWIVDNVDIQRPRLILTLGGVYNGPKATGTSDAP